MRCQAEWSSFTLSRCCRMSHRPMPCPSENPRLRRRREANPRWRFCRLLWNFRPEVMVKRRWQLAARHEPRDLGSTYETERAHDERDGEPDEKRGQSRERRVLVLLEIEKHLDGQREVRRPDEEDRGLGLVERGDEREDRRDDEAGADLREGNAPERPQWPGPQ